MASVFALKAPITPVESVLNNHPFLAKLELSGMAMIAKSVTMIASSAQVNSSVKSVLKLLSLLMVFVSALNSTLKTLKKMFASLESQFVTGKVAQTRGITEANLVIAISVMNLAKFAKTIQATAFTVVMNLTRLWTGNVNALKALSIMVDIARSQSHAKMANSEMQATFVKSVQMISVLDARKTPVIATNVKMAISQSVVNVKNKLMIANIPTVQSQCLQVVLPSATQRIV